MKKFFENVKEKVKGFFGSITSLTNKVFGFVKDVAQIGILFGFVVAIFTVITAGMVANILYFGAIKTRDLAVAGYDYTKGLFVKAEPITV